MSDLSSLIARLEKAEGPSVELDYLLSEEFRGTRLGAPDYTASIDDAVSLAERVLPGWFFEHIGNDAIGEDSDMAWLGWTVELSPGMALGAQGQAKSLPVAICLATLRALDQKGSSNG